jgi:hypothetical protein
VSGGRAPAPHELDAVHASGATPAYRAVAPAPAWELSAIALAIAGLVVLLQYRAHAYSVSFTDDDASHYINGLLIHDYLLHGLGSSPIAFLARFHSHYPLVGIGHWAPGYYVVEALWMLLVSTSLHGTLVLSALVTTVVALLIYMLLRDQTGRLIAALGAVGFVASPIVQNGSMQLMLDIPVALASLLAALVYARYLRTGSAGSAWLFGLLAGAAIMIKGNGAALALVPPLAILITGRWSLLRRVTFWLPAPVVLVIAGLWYAITYREIAAGFRYAWGLHYTLVALRDNDLILLDGVGPLVLALCAWGIVDMLRHGRDDARLVALAALLFSVWIFQMIVPAAIEGRYLAPLLPAVLIFAGRGLLLLSRLAARHTASPGVARTVLAGITCLSFVPSALSAKQLPDDGYFAAARIVRGLLPADNPAVLVVTPPEGENAMIAALASMDTTRPNLFVIRASRLLGGGGYNNEDYAPRFSDVADIMAAIDRYGVPLLVLREDRRPSGWAHIRQVQAASRREGTQWEVVARTGPVSDPVLIIRLHENDHRVVDAQALERLSAPRALR